MHHGRLAQLAPVRIARDAHDARARVRALADENALADRIGARPDGLRHRVAHDRDGLAAGAIVGAERAAAQDWRADRREVVVADRAHARAARLETRHRREAGHGDLDGEPIAERRADREARVLDAGNLPHAHERRRAVARRPALPFGGDRRGVLNLSDGARLTSTTITRSGSTPSASVRTFQRLRTNRPAPTSSTTDSAACAIVSA